MANNLMAKIGVSILSLVLLVSILEIGLRLTGRTTSQNPSPIYNRSDNPNLGYDLKPNVQVEAFNEIVTTDSRGFRSKEVDPIKPSLVFIGDSITFGYALKDEETLPARVQEGFSDWNVINAAVPGYNLIQEAAMYHEKVAPLEPKALVLVFFFNDFDFVVPVLDDKNLPRPPGWTPDKSQCIKPSAGAFKYIPGHCFLMSKSVFYKTFFTFSNSLKQNDIQKEERTKSAANPDVETVSREDLDKYEQLFQEFASSLPIDLIKFFVIWPDNFLHPTVTPELVALAEENGFTVVNFYDTFGNEIPTLPRNSLHPSSEAVFKAAKILIDVFKQHLP